MPRASKAAPPAAVTPRKKATPPAGARPRKAATPKRRKPNRGAANATEIHSRLAARYPDAHCALDYRNPRELLVATILSAQCTDKRVNMVTPALFSEYPSAESLAGAAPERLEELIRSTGFFRSKTRSILGMARALVDQHRGEVPATMDQLVKLPGVGRKTANVVLGNAFNINEGVVVDTHIGRVSARLGLTSETDPVKIEQDLMPLFPRESWTMIAHLFIEHGRTICVARTPKCGECPLNDLCPSSRVPAGTIGRAAPAVAPRTRSATAARSSPSASARSPKSRGRDAAGSRTSSPRPSRPGSRSR